MANWLEEHWAGAAARAVAVEELPVILPLTLPVTLPAKFPVTFPVTLPVTFPVNGPENPEAEIFPAAVTFPSAVTFPDLLMLNLLTPFTCQSSKNDAAADEISVMLCNT